MKKQAFTKEYLLIIAVFSLLAIGIVMVYSASSVTAGVEEDNSGFYLNKHIFRVFFGICMMIIMAQFNYEDYRKKNIPLIVLLTSIALLLYVLIADTAVIKGAQRWIIIAGFSFQPSEFAKYALILFMADALVRKQEKLKSFIDGFLPLFMVLTVVAVLIMMEPDFSTAALLMFLVFLIFFIGKVRLRHVLATGFISVPFLIMAISTSSYRLKRITSFFNPGEDRQGAGYQAYQSLISLGSGGFFGQGIGQSKLKLFYLPDSFTDFIFAVLGEEMGFIGTMFVIFLFLVILWRGFIIARNAQDEFGKLLASGITMSIVIAAFINAGVVCGALPATGMPMPFISYGGSSLLFSLIAVGVLLNISRKQHQQQAAENRYKSGIY